MEPQNNLKQLQDLFSQAKDILIITKEQPTIDGLCACLALKSAFSQKMDMQGKKKNVTLAISNRNGSQYSLLPGADQIVSELGLRDLVIGVNGFVEGSIENVNWYVDKGRLNVVFKSNPAVPMFFDLKNLDPFYAGANFDVVFVIDALSPSELGNAYKQDPGMYSELPVINVSNNGANTRFGRVNVVDPTVSSVCELAFQLGQITQANVMGDVATLFLTGIADATNNFSQKGSQTDMIVNQLTSFGGRQLDLEAIRNQASLPPLPVYKNPPPAVPGGVPPAMPNPPYGQYPNGQFMPYMPPSPYPQYPVSPMGYYPSPYPVPPQGYIPPYPPTPPYSVEDSFASTPQPVVDPGAVYNASPQMEQDFNESVPSIEHDMTQDDAYIPTGEPASFSHVEPSLYMPGIPQQPDIYAEQQDFNWTDQSQQYPQQPGQDAPLEERKESQKPPDFNAPPSGFIPGERKS